MGEAAKVRLEMDLELQGEMAQLRLPEGVDRRLQALLDKQDRGEPLTEDEQVEAEGLVELADLLSLLRLRASRAVG
ncbi:hypothetical protein [Polyangium sp. 15x6]|uniref:hypothetical protein n=1 Tax=Polyangium sp. 15x6 TaxID=3042687 RepID=UPI00249C0CB6|nr:hypothetical protein [Polyangium sp. 15x6]MDI3286158.1 hypothetical protein [Polyangium sp. 15x6]